MTGGGMTTIGMTPMNSSPVFLKIVSGCSHRPCARIAIAYVGVQSAHTGVSDWVMRRWRVEFNAMSARCHASYWLIDSKHFGFIIPPGM